MMALLNPQTLEKLGSNAELPDRELDWPAASWQVLSAAGVPAWSIPKEFGGRGLDALTLLAGYETMAGACLTTAFILSQREAPSPRLDGGATPERRFYSGGRHSVGDWRGQG